MRVIEARNVHEALQKGMFLLNLSGIRRESRVGDVLVMPEPVATLYQKPTERVLLWADRDANPFFHFMEGLWMLAGRNDVAWISQFNSTIGQFSDDGISFHGAYGHRWVNHFAKQIPSTNTNDDGFPTHQEGLYVPFNQLEAVVKMLKTNPNERRCVVQMWDAELDLGRVGKDVPCNTQIYFKIGTNGHLNMTVCNRSNDIIWGAYGANAVHMSMLQEFMAAWVGVPVGRYWQMSNDWHGYVDIVNKHKQIIEAVPYQPYGEGKKQIQPYPMVNGRIEDWISDLMMFMDEGPVPGFQDSFFRKVVSPIWNSWFAWKETEGSKQKRSEKALNEIQSCKASDWKRACEEWLLRRRG